MNKNDNRRKLLKSIAAGSGAVVAGKSIPESWSKPVVDTVLLPTHAATTETTSCPATISNSVPSSLTVVALTGAADEDQDGMEIHFDGCSSLRLIKGDESTGSADDLTFLDVDSDEPNVFDAETGPGANWQMISNSFPSDPYVSNVAEGPHTIQVKRLVGPTTGTVYTISFNVAVNGVTGGNEMTVSAVQASAN